MNTLHTAKTLVPAAYPELESETYTWLESDAAAERETMPPPSDEFQLGLEIDSMFEDVK